MFLRIKCAFNDPTGAFGGEFKSMETNTASTFLLYTASGGIVAFARYTMTSAVLPPQPRLEDMIFEFVDKPTEVEFRQWAVGNNRRIVKVESIST